MYLKKQFFDWEIVKWNFTFHSSYFSCFSLNIFHIMYLHTTLKFWLYFYLYCEHVCVWIQRHVEIRQLWGCRFPEIKLSYGMRLYLQEHLTNPPILKHWKIKNWAVAQMEECVCGMWEPLSLIPSMTWILCGGTHLKSQDLGKWI